MVGHLPDPTAAQRLCDRIVDTLKLAGSLQAVAVFGSLASHTADAASDVDMWVVCNDPDRDSWTGIQAIRQSLPVRFYRMFSSDRQPAGRYWFADESPLTRLDISFHTPQAYDEIRTSGQYLGHPVSVRQVYEADGASRERPDAAPRLLSISEEETWFGECLYRITRATKNAIRGTPFRYSIPECIVWMNEAIERTRGTRFAGGDGHALAEQFIGLAHHVHHQRPHNTSI